MSKEQKVYRARLELKDDAKGTFEAVFASLGPPPDHDQDITLENAFAWTPENERVAIGQFDHQGGLPVGVGHVAERGGEARVSGRFFTDTSVGRDHYETVKELRPEWSYQFAINESEPGTWNNQRVRYLKRLTVFSIDPVLKGAGLGVRTEWVKSGDTPDLGRIKAGGYDFGPYISENPAAALRQLRYAYVEITGEPMGGPYISSDPAAARKQLALESGDAGELRALIESDLFKAEVERLEAAVKQGGDHPTNFDHLVEQLRRAFGPSVSDAYLVEAARVHLADLAVQLQRDNVGVTPDQAWRRVARWARQAV